ncbi:Adenosylcobinamide kinase / Adenosylcobinamide-phosphate guanylyltransferase [hydrothermal vent metagenome]|uniref:Adenosylcobinamide kinase n=1 Tax=hydrothermal vent metagenome TaxID=652676 RepID=A0A3B1AH41_9ZZZZ
MIELILGGARSGKSGYAQQCAIDNNKNVLLIATATADDNEMAQRIKLHKQQRPNNIEVIEEPLKLSAVLTKPENAGKSILIDCLTLWVSNLLLKYKEKIEDSSEFNEFIDCLDTLAADVYIVSNEVGMGIIPLGHLNRIYCDAVGRLHQAIATKAQRVTLMVAGLPHSIKSETKL